MVPESPYHGVPMEGDKEHEDDIRMVEGTLQTYRALIGSPAIWSEQQTAEATRLAQHVIDNRRKFSRGAHLTAQFLSHALSGILGVDVHREHNELLALLEAGKELKSTGGASEDRIHALVLMAIHGSEPEEVARCIEELLEKGDGLSLALACIDAPDAFHASTDLQYLNHVLSRLQDPGLQSGIFTKKMGILVQQLKELDEESRHGEEGAGIQREVLTCYLHLHILPIPGHKRVMAQYYLSCLAYIFRDFQMAAFHAEGARALAEYFGMTKVQKAVEQILRKLQEME